jgi:hypothetical protein
VRIIWAIYANEAIADLCRRFHVERLEVFGSMRVQGLGILWGLDKLKS